MNKLYDRIDFVNNTTPALNETNLNAMSKAIDDIDDRVIEIAGDVLVVVPEILDKYADIEALATNPPYVGQNGHWWTWDTDLNQYVDSGVDAGVSVTVGATTTLPAGSSATVTNSGTDTDPVLNFGIPQGAAGQNGQDGVSPEVTIGEITGGHSVTITDAEHPSGQTFNVLDGVDGQDGQDGADGVGVPSGGTTGQVLKKVSSTDYDTEWANESGGGSDGHTIINSAGTSMTQRAGLQFEGMGVTDDSTNDKTVVTLPTPDYVDEQYNNSTTYSKGMTCIEGNVRYRYKNSTATSGHRPPNATYWEVLSVAEEIKGSTEHVLYDSGNKTSSNWTNDTANNRYMIQVGQTAGVAKAVTDGASAYGRDRVFIVITVETGVAVTNYCIPAYIPKTASVSGKFDQITSIYPVSLDALVIFNFPLSTVNTSQIYMIIYGSGRSTWVNYTLRFRIIAFS